MSSESVQPDVEPRTIRAAAEYMYVEEVANALFEVTSQLWNVYTVDLGEPVCECNDHQYRDEVGECKHTCRVRLEVGQIDVEALESELERTANEFELSAAQLEKTIERLREVAGHE